MQESESEADAGTCGCEPGKRRMKEGVRVRDGRRAAPSEARGRMGAHVNVPCSKLGSPLRGGIASTNFSCRIFFGDEKALPWSPRVESAGAGAARGVGPFSGVTPGGLVGGAPPLELAAAALTAAASSRCRRRGDASSSPPPCRNCLLGDACDSGRAVSGSGATVWIAKPPASSDGMIPPSFWGIRYVFYKSLTNFCLSRSPIM